MRCLKFSFFCSFDSFKELRVAASVSFILLKYIMNSGTVLAENARKYLRAHVKREHPDKAEILCPKKVYKSCAICTDCNKSFVSKRSLRAHIKNKHPGKLSDIEAAKENDLKCSDWNQLFKNLYQLKIHRRTHAVLSLINCSLCSYCDTKTEVLKSHFKEFHNLEIKIEEREFKSFDEFKISKSEVEQETVSSFINSYGCYKTKEYTRYMYTCHRLGQVRLRGNGLRHMKIQGSTKVNGYCPASMKVIIKNEHC